MVSVTQNNHQHKPLMVQAPVRALDPDGVAVVTAGTLAFAIGAGICWWNSATLIAAGKLWYLGVAVAGTVIGLLGLGFGLFRKLRRRRGTLDDVEPVARRALPLDPAPELDEQPFSEHQPPPSRI